MRDEAKEIADSKITIHDKHRFEIKLDIELAEHKKSTYRVETFFFVPRALNISPSTYSKDRFYNSMQKYIRFKTPRFSLKKIIDPSVETSPFTRIKKNLSDLPVCGKEKELTELTYYEIKLLGVVTRSAIRDFVRHLIDELAIVKKSGPSGARFKLFKETGNAFAQDVTDYVDAIHGLKEEILNPAIPVRLREAFLFFDEFISLTIEDFLAALLSAVRENPAIQEGLPELDKAIAKIIRGQQTYRKSMGFPSVLSPGGRNSILPYRRGVLKKFISNVLFLNMEVSEWEGWSQVPLAIAAGFAMLFAAVVTFFAQSKYTTNSATFIAVVVISYIFKDRLKDWLKLYFSKGMVRWIADRKIRIKDPVTGQLIGTFKEAFSFVEHSSVPPEVLYRRNMDNITSIDEEGKPERIIKYEKEVILYPKRVSRFHERLRDLNDIMRLNIDDFLRQADDPVVDYLHLNDQTGKLEQVQCERVYHVNMVLRYESENPDERASVKFERIRLVLNRNGIVRMEEVTTRVGGVAGVV